MSNRESNKITVVIAAGGTGTRFGGNLPKQFVLLGDRPVLWHTLMTFSRFSPGIKIIVAMHSQSIEMWERMIRTFEYTPGHTVVEGGKTRFHSVKNALALCPDDGIILVHDAVRPFVSPSMIERVSKMAFKSGTAIPVTEICDSVRQITNNGSKSVDRKSFVRVQTPQGFKAKLLKESFKKRFSKKFTDEASVVESAGFRINLVEGEEANIKITHREDICTR